ncbi:MAG: FixH family protein [Longimicrobiales bacterium]|nr:FixH family protein [Longimicrobiales bacterium]
MNPHGRMATLLLLSTLLAGACRGEMETGDAGLVLELAISPTPPAVGQARLIISLEDSAGAPVDGAEILVEGNMSHAGMAPVVDTAQAEGPGRYGIADFRFKMAGDWVLPLRATLPDGRWVQAGKATNVVGAMGGGR